MRIFLSSRFTEFRALRSALKAFGVPGVEFVELDDGEPTTVGPLERSIQELKRSDAVVMFLGTTLGAPIDDGRSILEHEWQIARELDLPRLGWFTADLVDALGHSDSALDLRLRSLAESLRDSGVVIGTLAGDDSLRVVRAIERELLGDGSTDPDTPGVQPAPMRHEPELLSTLRRLSSELELPVDDAGPAFAAPMLVVRARAFDSLQRRLPADAYESLRRILAEKSPDVVPDIATVWMFAEMVHHYRSQLQLATFVDDARLAIDGLARLGDSLPLGGTNTPGVDERRSAYLFHLRGQLLQLVAPHIEAESADEQVGQALDDWFVSTIERSLDLLDRETQRQELSLRVSVGARLGRIDAMGDAFFALWHWNPGLAAAVVSPLADDHVEYLLDAVHAEAVRDLGVVFGDRFPGRSELDGGSVRGRLLWFRRRLQALVDEELQAITAELLLLRPDAIERSVRLTTALRFPAVYLPRYVARAEYRRLGDFYRSADAPAGLRAVTFDPRGIAPANLDAVFDNPSLAGRFLHAWPTAPDGGGSVDDETLTNLYALWHVVQARTIDDSIDLRSETASALSALAPRLRATIRNLESLELVRLESATLGACAACRWSATDSDPSLDAKFAAAIAAAEAEARRRDELGLQPRPVKDRDEIEFLAARADHREHERLEAAAELERRRRAVESARAARLSAEQSAAQSPPDARHPAGWYTDPTSRFPQRYWDGTEWTAWVARDGVTSEDPMIP